MLSEIRDHWIALSVAGAIAMIICIAFCTAFQWDISSNQHSYKERIDHDENIDRGKVAKSLGRKAQKGALTAGPSSENYNITNWCIVLIANGAYKKFTNLSPYTRKDAEEMSRFAQTLDVQPHPSVYFNVPGRKIKTVFKSALATVTQRSALLFYFTGHGAENVIFGVDGEKCLRKKLLTIAKMVRSVPDSSTEQAQHSLFEDQPKVFIFDCCNGVKELKANADQPVTAGDDEWKDFLIIEAAHIGEAAYKDPKLGCSLLTHHLVQDLLAADSVGKNVSEVVVKTASKVTLHHLGEEKYYQRPQLGPFLTKRLILNG